MAKNDIEELGKMPFEKALDELEQLVKKMEDGNLSLDEMLSCFERGCQLSKTCRAKLERLEKKIEILLKDDGKEGEWEDFDSRSTREVAATTPRTTAPLDNEPDDDDEDFENNEQESDFLF